MMGNIADKIDIEGVLKACGVKHIAKANPLDLQQAKRVVKEAAYVKGISVVIFEAPCIAVAKPKAKSVIGSDCIQCGSCISEIGCPAISKAADESIVIDQGMCYGCGLCQQICPVEAIQCK